MRIEAPLQAILVVVVIFVALGFGFGSVIAWAMVGVGDSAQVRATPATPRPTATPFSAQAETVETNPRRSAPTQAPTPEPPVRAMSVSYRDIANSQNEVAVMAERMQAIDINMVGLNAGRLDWNYFQWEGREENWSSEVENSNVDYLMEDANRFGEWAHISAVVDVFAPRYIERNPDSAAITADGERLDYQVSTMELVEGAFGEELLAMLDYIAATYPVDSITLTELFYYREGYGEVDRQAYRAYTGREDFPRTLWGAVDVDHPSIGEWRSYEISRFIAKAAEVVHQYDKELFVDVRVSWGNLANESRENGQDYTLLLEHADRLVIWNYFGLNDYTADYTEELARYLEKFGDGKVIVSIGLWGEDDSIVPPADLRHALHALSHTNLPHFWITPSFLLNDMHWEVLEP
jgi:hypothetical protein